MHPMLSIMLMDAQRAELERRVRAARRSGGRARTRHPRGTGGSS
jgi:hypothetical protein